LVQRCRRPPDGALFAVPVERTDDLEYAIAIGQAGIVAEFVVNNPEDDPAGADADSQAEDVESGK